MTVVAAFFRCRVVQVYPYLNDWLIKGQLQAQVQNSINMVQATFQALGLLINKQKSTVFLVQRIEFIGKVLDMTQAKASLPEACFQVMPDLISRVTTYPLTTARVCLKLLSHIAACT